jgi:hypothetical protein
VFGHYDPTFATQTIAVRTNEYSGQQEAYIPPANSFRDAGPLNPETLVPMERTGWVLDTQAIPSDEVGALPETHAVYRPGDELIQAYVEPYAS